jgi:hypothetical protein
MTRALLIASWLVAAACLWLAHESARLAAEATAEAREAQLIACAATRIEGRMLGWEVSDDCHYRWPTFTDPPMP